MIHLLMSINPNPLSQILNGTKTIEIRKRIPECLKKGEPITVWGYCTKGKPWLYKSFATNEDGYTYCDGYFLTDDEKEAFILNGLVVCKFVVEKAAPKYHLHITSLEIIDPMKLGEFRVENPALENIGAFGWAFTEQELTPAIPLTRSPQSWMYVLPPKEGEGK